MLQHQILIGEHDPRRYHSFFVGADVGGTNISLVLAGLTGPDVREAGGEKIEMLVSFKAKTAGVRDFFEPLEEALDYCRDTFGAPAKTVAIAAAGPVEGHRWCRLTNINLEIDAEKLGDRLNVPCFLLNDFEALGYSINYLEAEKPELLLELDRGGERPFPPVKPGVRVTSSPRPPGARALLGVGTGLGKAILAPNSELGFYITLPSEGGHADFPVQDPFEWELVSYIKQVTGFPVYYEDLLSGRGLGNTYSFVRAHGLHPTSHFTSIIEKARDKAPAIAKYYLQDEAAKHTVDLFVNVFARCARNFALDVLARGGVYLAGGIVTRNLKWITGGEFAREFENHRQYRPVLEQIPLLVITSYEAGTYGAAFVAAKGEELWSRIV
ncbi:MAG: glucokinase [Chloroflexi bacterium]|nr:glucokinase [Chloroflexota bacterium]